MRGWRGLWVAVPAVLLAVLLVMIFATRGTMEELAFLRRSQADAGPVDQRPAETALALAPMAVSADEQGDAAEAERLANHEVDQAFAMALREASMEHRTLTGPALETARRVDALKSTVAQDKAAVDAATAAATAAAASGPTAAAAATSGVASGARALAGGQAKAQANPAGAAAGAATAGGAAAATAPTDDDLDVARAQLALDTDDLEDATSDLQRESGDLRTKIQAEAQNRQSAPRRAGAGTGESAVASAKRHGTLWARADAWFDQRNRAGLIAQAGERATADARTLGAEHDAKQAQAAEQGQRDALLRGQPRVKALEAMGSERVVMSILDDRVQTDTELAALYTKWGAQVAVQHRIVEHLLLVSAAWIVLVVLLAASAIAALRAGLAHWMTDKRQRATLLTISELAIELLAAITVILIVWGPPAQMPTILGLAGAGLTVVFQDYILAFFGWFVLMGRNGLRVCDWVEIDGTGGEVLEIGLFRTTLLETGNWTSRGHPTGRKATFSNSFAIRGSFFNYTTHGQWMWDEIRVSVGAGAYELIDRLKAAVELESAADVEEAEAEWQSASARVGLAQFGAAPSVELRPAASGNDVVVRFVTRAPERFDRRAKVYQGVMGVLRESEASTPTPQG